MKRNLKTKESQEFWAFVDKLIESLDSTRPVAIGDQYLDSYKDVSPSLIDCFPG